MNIMNWFLENIQRYQLIVLTVLLALSLTWNLVSTIQISNVNKKYKRFMRGATVKNIEQLVLDQMDTVEVAVNRVELMNKDLLNLKNQVDKCIQKHGIVRYNAFKDVGSDLSYTIALLDNFNNGVLLTGIYGRNETVSFAKPIESGKSSYSLSDEEQLVLEKSLKTRER